MNGAIAANHNGHLDKAVGNGRVPANGSASSSSSDDEDDRERRPVNIEQDVREMERRKRVEAIMSSNSFREELERVVADALIEASVGSGTANQANRLNSVANDISHAANCSFNRILSNHPHSRGQYHPGLSLSSSSAVIPINDIRGLDGMAYQKTEKEIRCRLASCYRLVHLAGWDQSVYNHITLRLSSESEHFLIQPFGLNYSEVTASSLVKIDMQGKVVDPGATSFGGSVNEAGFTLHAAVHAARPDIKCIIHLHLPAIVAVASCKSGLLPICQEACLLGQISYHNYEGLVVTADEQKRLVSDMGVHNKVMLLRNHGAICCGQTVEEAFFYASHLVLACQTQLATVTIGLDSIQLIDEPTQRRVFDMAQKGGGGVHMVNGQRQTTAEDGNEDAGGNKAADSSNLWQPHWSVGEMEFEAAMRLLDNAGYRTGYPYRLPLMKGEPDRSKSDVQLPPTVSSLSYLLDEEHMHKDGPLSYLLSAYARQSAMRAENGHSAQWINSPNVYQKIEVSETGTDDPKKISKWVHNGGKQSVSSMHIKVESPGQFVPLGTSKKEFKKVQQAMKDGRRAGGLTSGPESRVLTAPAVTEQILVQADGSQQVVRGSSVMGVGSTTPQLAHGPGSRAATATPQLGADVEYRVGAASKGIIQRDFQHNATVYSSAYAANPFDGVSEDELRNYKSMIESKSGRGTACTPATTAGNGNVREYGNSPPPEGCEDSTFNDTTDNTYTNGEETDGNRTLSDDGGDTSRATDVESPLPGSDSKKAHKKRSGLRTPSFLKRKKKDRKSGSKKDGHPLPPTPGNRSQTLPM